MAEAVNALFDERPDVRDAFIDAQDKITFYTTDLSPDTLQIMEQAIRGNWKYERYPKTIPDNLDELLKASTVRISSAYFPFSDSHKTRLTSFGIWGVGSSEGSFLGCYLCDPGSALASVEAELRIRRLEEEKTKMELWKEMEPDFTEARVEAYEEHEEYTVMEPRLEHADDPELQKECVFDLKPDESKDGLEEVQNKRSKAARVIAEATGYSVVSDSYASNVIPVTVTQGTYIAQDLLDELTQEHYYNWNRSGSVIELKCRDWFRLRDSQLPDEVVAKWRKSLEANHTFTLHEFAQIAALSDDQIYENCVDDPVLHKLVSFPGEFYFSDGGRAFLKLYLCMNDQQRALLQSEEGIDIRILSNPDQWRVLVDSIRRCSRGNMQSTLVRPSEFLEKVDTGVKIRLERLDEQCYHFAITTDDDSGELHACFRIPKSKQPAPPADDKEAKN